VLSLIMPVRVGEIDMKNVDKSRMFFILGAQDPEMNKIEEVLKEENLKFGYALNNKGERVKPFEANRAVGVSETLTVTDVPYMVECRVTGLDYAMVVDHHNPGDPGYGLPPSLYLEGSSLGQVFKLLGRESSKEDLLVAAADHCLGAAYRGQCPGVDPIDLREWRSNSRASFQGISREEYDVSLDEGIEFVKDLPELETPVGPFKDSRSTDGHRQLPEASAILGLPVLYRKEMRDRKLGKDAPVDGVKVGLLNGSPEEIRYFLDQLVPELGLLKPYGDPDRGFAGAYEELPSSMKD
jgi:hypothetical protein